MKIIPKILKIYPNMISSGGGALRTHRLCRWSKATYTQIPDSRSQILDHRFQIMEKYAIYIYTLLVQSHAIRGRVGFQKCEFHWYDWILREVCSRDNIGAISWSRFSLVWHDTARAAWQVLTSKVCVYIYIYVCMTKVCHAVRCRIWLSIHFWPHIRFIRARAWLIQILRIGKLRYGVDLSWR